MRPTLNRLLQRAPFSPNQIRHFLQRALAAPAFAFGLAATMLGASVMSPAFCQQRIQSPAHQVSLVELFTSEGCSSCPPADQWMSELKTDKRLWNTVVPVAFHVDYWDYIGWPDRFASSVYSTRHRDYQRLAGLRSVYTPGFLVRGEEWRGWFRYPTLELTSPPPAGIITLDVNADGSQVAVDYTVSQATPAALEIHLAVLGFDLKTDVRGGENDGRVLQHDFVVLGYQRLDLKGTSPKFNTISPMPTLREPASRTALAAWVNRKGNPKPIQATGGWLQN